MTFEQEQILVKELKIYITENFALNRMDDAELEEKVEQLVEQKIGNQYCPINQKVSIVQQVYSSIRGLGLLDTIMNDDTITEVMINGPENIFIEQHGKVTRLDKQFESQKRLEDVIQNVPKR